MTCRSLIITFLIIIVFTASGSVRAQKDKKWYQKWDAYPSDNKVPRIMADQVKQLRLQGAKLVFVYAGYKVNQVVCGSIYIPYTVVPPAADGSRIKLRIPKDWWIICY